MTVSLGLHAAIEIEGLNKVYQSRGVADVHAVKNLHLSVPKGQVFGFLGANGAGKTTTIKMLCGLITPTSGRIRVNGYDVVHQHRETMQQIGAVLEGTRNVYWRLSAWQNLMYFGRLKGYSRKEIRARAEHLLHDLEMWDRRNDVLRHFSRGMQQKIAIACALISDPPIVLLDEPTLGLDIQAAITVKAWIASLAREHNKTIVLTTHQLDVAQELCDRVAIMSKGRLLVDQPLEELLHLFHHEYYQIKLRGHLERQLAPWFDSWSINNEDGNTILSGSISDQAALYGLITKLHDLHLPLLSITQVEPNLEEVFIDLMKETNKGETHENHHAST